MNLQEVLNYRKKCLICNRQMKVRSRELAIDVIMTKEGLYVCSSPAESKTSKEYFVHFKFDGTYVRGKRWWETYSQPITLVKECPKCNSDVEPEYKSVKLNNKPTNLVILKGRSVGATTLTNAILSYFWQIKDNHCGFSFQLYGENGSFESRVYQEDLQFRTKDNFYHMKTDFIKEITYIKAGDLKKSFDDIMRIEVAAVNTSKILTKEQLIEKIKLYNLFS